mmetsp:Transcript_73865/g.225904  ORF Transcript_73865/g.225904 Transcript_73865/m.225904 type:complete len:247 (-) Transcript_73865:73-813(-)
MARTGLPYKSMVSTTAMTTSIVYCRWFAKSTYASRSTTALSAAAAPRCAHARNNGLSLRALARSASNKPRANRVPKYVGPEKLLAQIVSCPMRMPDARLNSQILSTHGTAIATPTGLLPAPVSSKCASTCALSRPRHASHPAESGTIVAHAKRPFMSARAAPAASVRAHRRRFLSHTHKTSQATGTHHATKSINSSGAPCGAPIQAAKLSRGRNCSNTRWRLAPKTWPSSPGSAWSWPSTRDIHNT